MHSDESTFFQAIIGSIEPAAPGDLIRVQWPSQSPHPVRVPERIPPVVPGTVSLPGSGL